MRRKGIDLACRRGGGERLRAEGGKPEKWPGKADVDTGILEVDSRYQDNLKSFWSRAKPWVRRIVSLAITIAIFYWAGRKISMHWESVKDRAGSVSIVTFFVAAVMFAAFLFGVRAMSWRRIDQRILASTRFPSRSGRADLVFI